MKKIKPCPFCGSRAVLSPFESEEVIEATVICTHCCAAGPLHTAIVMFNGEFEVELYDLEKQAIKAWNKVKR
jgi:transcription elongation factor Elf1